MDQIDEMTMMEIESALEIADSMDGMDNDIFGDDDNELEHENADLVGRATEEVNCFEENVNSEDGGTPDPGPWHCRTQDCFWKHCLLPSD